MKTKLLQEISVDKIMRLQDIILGKGNLFVKFEAEQEMRLIKNAFELADKLKHEKFLRDLTEAKLDEITENEVNDLIEEKLEDVEMEDVLLSDDPDDHEAEADREADK